MDNKQAPMAYEIVPCFNEDYRVLFPIVMPLNSNEYSYDIVIDVGTAKGRLTIIILFIWQLQKG